MKATEMIIVLLKILGLSSLIRGIMQIIQQTLTTASMLSYNNNSHGAFSYWSQWLPILSVNLLPLLIGILLIKKSECIARRILKITDQE
jgi:predicted phage tail protein